MSSEANEEERVPKQLNNCCLHQTLDILKWGTEAVKFKWDLVGVLLLREHVFSGTR